jgi:hypothetical protein
LEGTSSGAYQAQDAKAMSEQKFKKKSPGNWVEQAHPAFPAKQLSAIDLWPLSQTKFSSLKN